MVGEKPKQKCNENVTIYNKLPILEVCVYYVGWISGMFCMLYGVYKTSMEYQNRNEVLVEGWSFLGSKKDVSDYVIEMEYQAINHIIFYGILHYVIAEVIKFTSRKVLPYYYFLFSISIITYYSSYQLGIVGIVVIVQALFSFTVAYFGNQFYIWSYGLTAIATVYFILTNLLQWCNLQDFYLPILMSLLLWNNLRYLTFALYINKRKETKIITYNDFVNFLGYYFYFPTFFHGPLLLYEDFQNVYTIQPQDTFYNRLLKFTASIIKCTIYLYLAIFLLHFLHFGLLFQLSYIHISYPASHGFFWWAGFLFMLKYMILYGLASSAAKAEGIRTPNPPICIGRIALYSSMWKNFDQSMYWFKKKYIFEAFVCNSQSKLKQMIGSFLCFIFIIVWHGGRQEIILWALLNYVEAVVEGLGKEIIKTKLFLKMYRNYLNPKLLRRLAAVCSVPLFSVSIISQYLFLSTQDIVHNHLKRMMQEDYVIHGLVLFTAYCACQVSIDIKMWEKINNEDDKKEN